MKKILAALARGYPVRVLNNALTRTPRPLHHSHELAHDAPVERHGIQIVKPAIDAAHRNKGFGMGQGEVHGLRRHHQTPVNFARVSRIRTKTDIRNQIDPGYDRDRIVYKTGVQPLKIPSVGTSPIV